MKNVGRYPDQDTSVSHVELAQNRLNEVSMTEEQILGIVDGRTGSYLTPAQVDAEAATKLPKSGLSSLASSYISASQVTLTSSSSYVALSSGKIPTAQLPPGDQPLYFEGIMPTTSNSTTNTLTATSANAIAVGSFSAGTTFYKWKPVIFASIEVNVTSGSPPVSVYIQDSANKTVAWGQSTIRNGFNRVSVFPRVSTSYDGYETFTWYLRFNVGTGSVRATLFEDSMSVFIAPQFK